jgi:hypothetical protein
MCCWDVPPSAVAEIGRRVAAFPEVTHCYERPLTERFPFRLYAMIHTPTWEGTQALFDGLRTGRGCRTDSFCSLWPSSKRPACSSSEGLMKIVCDKNMPYAAEAFRTLGEVVLKSGRGIAPEDVRDADALITRSPPRVDRGLLEGSSVRFYGSGVIGTDHIDIPYLESRDRLDCAPGCNAESVANYVTAALLWLGGRYGLTLEGKTLGVIGVGNVGRRVCRHARALGLRVLANDPPRQRRPDDAEACSFVDLDRVLSESDIVTCHVPLTKAGPDADVSSVVRGAFCADEARRRSHQRREGARAETDALLAVLGTRVAHAVHRLLGRRAVLPSRSSGAGRSCDAPYRRPFLRGESQRHGHGLSEGLRLLRDRSRLCVRAACAAGAAVADGCGGTRR